MKQRRPTRASLRVLTTLAGVTALLAGCAKLVPPPAPDSPAFYEVAVQPILRANCYRCHSGMNHKGGLQLDSPEAIRRGGKHGPVIVPGHPEDSLLIQLIRHEDTAKPPRPMPPRSRLSDAEIAAVTAWVNAGAR